MPPYYKVAYALWGKTADFDSDGDSDAPDSTSWRELTVTLRSDFKERLDIDPVNENRDLLKIESTSLELLDRACVYLESVRAVKIQS